MVKITLTLRSNSAESQTQFYYWANTGRAFSSLSLIFLLIGLHTMALRTGHSFNQIVFIEHPFYDGIHSNE